jgi:hypothetical protein
MDCGNSMFFPRKLIFSGTGESAIEKDFPLRENFFSPAPRHQNSWKIDEDSVRLFRNKTT